MALMRNPVSETGTVRGQLPFQFLLWSRTGFQFGINTEFYSAENWFRTAIETESEKKAVQLPVLLLPPAQKTLTNDGGQAVLEYILLLSIVVSIYLTVATWANSYGLAGKMLTPITKDFAAVYQFGDPKAAGFDSDTPKRHPRIEGCDECFRLFINPSVQ
jgi:hypothetical protein